MNKVTANEILTALVAVGVIAFLAAFIGLALAEVWADPVAPWERLEMVFR